MNNNVNFVPSNTNESFMAKLYVNKKQLINSKCPINRLDDTVSLPIFESERLLSQEGNSIVEIMSSSGNVVHAKVTQYDYKPRTIAMPQWMIDCVKVKDNDLVKIVTKKVQTITRVKVKSPKEITNSLGILEFELKDRNLLYKGEIITVKMFEKKYQFVVDKIYNQNTELDMGLLYGNGMTAEIIYDIEIV